MSPTLRRVAALLSGLLLASAVSAQTYPSKPVRLIVPFAPGGFTDVVARILGQRLSVSMGQQFIIENKAGAGSTIGTDFVAKAAPDGYTLVMISTTHVISPWIYKSMPYDPIKGFVPVTKLVDSPYVLLVNPKLPTGEIEVYATGLTVLGEAAEVAVRLRDQQLGALCVQLSDSVRDIADRYDDTTAADIDLIRKVTMAFKASMQAGPAHVDEQPDAIDLGSFRKS